MSELGVLIDQVQADNEIRALVVTGAGEKFFSAGADLKEMPSLFGGETGPGEMTRRGQAIFTKFERSSTPVIAAINGMAFGGGCELALACHFRVAAQSAKIGLVEVNVGIMPGYGGTQRLPRLIGRAKAIEMATLGLQVPAEAAFGIGLLNEVVPDAELLGKAKEFAKRVAAQAPVAVSLIIDAIIRGSETDIDQGQNIEAENFEKVVQSADAIEGVQAFIQKRKPNYQGR